MPTTEPNVIDAGKSGAPFVVLTVEQVADRFQIPKSSVYEMTRFRSRSNGRPPLPVRRVGKYLRFIGAEVDGWFLALPQANRTAKRRYRMVKREPAFR
jgi:predicted DNA-binding transcriptional regulator AlpA